MATPTAQQMLDKYLQAELDVLAGKSVRFNDGNTERELRSEDLEWIIKGRKEWEARVERTHTRFGGLNLSHVFPIRETGHCPAWRHGPYHHRPRRA